MLDKELAKDVALEERAGFLRDNCDDVEEIEYSKSFSTAEMAEWRERLASADLLIDEIEEEVKREREENGNVGLAFKQQVVGSNIPESFNLKLPVFSGGEYVTIEVETFASIDGANVTLALQSAGANDAVEEYKANGVQAVLNKIMEIAPEIAIIEQ